MDDKIYAYYMGKIMYSCAYPMRNLIGRSGPGPGPGLGPGPGRIWGVGGDGILDRARGGGEEQWGGGWGHKRPRRFKKVAYSSSCARRALLFAAFLLALQNESDYLLLFLKS